MRAVQPELHDPVAEHVVALVVLVRFGIRHDHRRADGLRRRRARQHARNAVPVEHRGAIDVLGAVHDPIPLSGHVSSVPSFAGRPVLQDTTRPRLEPCGHTRRTPRRGAPRSTRPIRTTPPRSTQGARSPRRRRAPSRDARLRGEPHESPTQRSAGCGRRRRRGATPVRTRRRCDDVAGTPRGSRSTRGSVRSRADAGSRAGGRRLHRRSTTSRPRHRFDTAPTPHERRRSHRMPARVGDRPHRSATPGRARRSRSTGRRARRDRRGSTRGYDRRFERCRPPTARERRPR